jgi:DNA-binding transcriptional MocR family regulator
MPNAYELMSDAELDAAIVALENETERLRALDLKLDMARGKPSPEQVALSRPMLDLVDSTTTLDDGGVAVGNYGAPDGLPSARALAAQIMGVDPANVVVNGSSSLNLMHDLVCHAYTHGIGGNKPWCQQRKVKFLCPSPGYDRHFRVSAHYGIENVPVPMLEDGPDMETIVRLVEADPAVKGVWCVPRYANPTGITYSDEVVRQFAGIRPAAPDFRIFWDNAYAVHTFADDDAELLNIFDALAEAGQTDLVYAFGSTAKITFPGSGMAYVTASSADMAEIRSAFSVMRVSPEKFSQLAHVLFLKDLDGVKAHMRRHAAVVGPRFALVEQKLTEGLGALRCATWTHPKGGYFVSFDGPEGSAKAIVKLAADLGVKMTPAGATWPYGNDPHDTNIRIAPTYPSLEELGRALDVFVVAVSLVSARLAKAARA